MPKADKKKTKHQCVPYARGYKPPSAKKQLQAIGFGNSPSLLPVEYQNEHDPKIGHFFSSIPQPISIDDWLAQYAEDGQSYKEYMEENPWLSNRKHKFIKQKFVPRGKYLTDKYPDGKIYVAKLGDFSDGSFEDLIHYVSIFLSLPVEKLESMELEKGDEGIVKFVERPKSDPIGRSTSRIRYTTLRTRYNRKAGHIQLRGDSILLKMRSVIPNDALCVIALTDYDLYEAESDLFVAGLASGNERVAVFSLLRYDPTLAFSKEFWFDIKEDKKVSQQKKSKLMLQRSCKLLVHEICHLLGIDHCIFYSCCMNGSGHLEEDFSQPMMLCPVDLHKLQSLVGFDISQRYKKLHAFYQLKGLQEEANWMKARLDYIQKQESV